MHEKSAGFFESINMSGLSMEDTISRWLENKLEDFGVVEKDLKRHVRTFVGIFRLSRQDLIQDIKEEPQYPLEVRNFMDGQSSLENLRKHVFVFELMKLTCLGKEQADLIVDELFAECNMITEEHKKEEQGTGRPLQTQFVGQPASRSAPASRSEQEIRYANAFPALPPKGAKPKLPPGTIPNFWMQRSPLRSNPSVQTSKNKIGTHDSSSEKASTLIKKIRTGGKENECGLASTESKKKICKNRDLRNRRESSTTSQSPKSFGNETFLVDASCQLKLFLGVGEKTSKHVSSALGKKEEARSQESKTSNANFKKYLMLNPFTKPDQSVWDHDHITEHPWWDPTLKQEDTTCCASQNHRSTSEPQLEKQELRVTSRQPDEESWSFTERMNSSCSLLQPACPLEVDVPSNVFLSESLDQDIRDIFNSADLADQDHHDFHSAHSCDATSRQCLGPVLYKSFYITQCDCSFCIWGDCYITRKSWPRSAIDSHHQLQEHRKPAFGHVPSTDNAKLLQEFFSFLPKQSDQGGSCSRFRYDSGNQQLQETAAVSSGDLNHQAHEQMFYPAVQCPTGELNRNFPCASPLQIDVGQGQFRLDTASDFENQKPQETLLMVCADKNPSQDASWDGDLPPGIEWIINQQTPQSSSQCSIAGAHSHHRDQEFLLDLSSTSDTHIDHQSSTNNSCPTSGMQINVKHYSLFGSTSHEPTAESPSNSSSSFSLSMSLLSYVMKQDTDLPPDTQSVHLLESGNGHEYHPMRELHSDSASRAQPFQNSHPVEDFRHNTEGGHSAISASYPYFHPGIRDDAEKKQEDDQFGIRSLVYNVEQSWQDFLKEPLSPVPSLPHDCSCEGACNCQFMPPVNSSQVNRAADVQNAFDSSRHTRPGRSMQVPQNNLRSASCHELPSIPSEKSAFKQVRRRSRRRSPEPRVIPPAVRTLVPCLVKDASERQRKRILENSMKFIRPEESVDSSHEDVVVSEYHDAWGKWTRKVDLSKQSKETQTSDCDFDFGTSLSRLPVERKSPEKVYEEKHWKDLLPLSAEDRQRDLLYAAIQAQKQGIPHSHFLDVAELEEYEFADFQLLSETSASLHIPHSQAVYVKDLEKAWLSESYRRLGKNKVRRPLHPTKPCSFYLEGCCYRFDCKYSHDINTITCQFWEVGECFKGDLCPFLHGYFGGLAGSDGADEFDVTKEDFPELTRKGVRLNSAPASKRRRSKKNSVHRLQLPRGT